MRSAKIIGIKHWSFLVQRGYKAFAPIIGEITIVKNFIKQFCLKRQNNICYAFI